MKKAISYFVVSLFVFVSIFPVRASKHESQKIKIIFRYDDFQLTPTGFNDSLLLVFQKNKIPLCIGIIPFDTNKVFHNELNQKQLTDFKSRIKNHEIEVNLHGFNHEDVNWDTRSFFMKEYKSEFAFSDYTKQYERLSRAKKALDSLLDITIQTFVPPWDSYDYNTLKVLEKLNFKIISADYNGPTDSDNIKYMPNTFENFDQLPEFIKRHKNDAATVILLFHPYTFKECWFDHESEIAKRISFHQLDTLLNWVHKQDNITYYTFSTLVKTETFNKARFEANAQKGNLFFKLLSTLNLYRTGIYSTVEYKYRIQNPFVLLNIIFHLLCFWISYRLSQLFIKILKPNVKLIYLLGVVMTLTISYILLWYSKSVIWTTIFIFLIGNTAAIILGIISGYKTLNVTKYQKVKPMEDAQIITNKKSIVSKMNTF